MKLSDRKKGVLLAVAGGAFWGGSGVAGQVLLQDCGFATGWLVTVRMLLAGVILLMIDAVQHRGDIWSIWQDRRNIWELLIFAWAGMLIVQYSYFACIAYGNAAAATVLQYLMPAFIVLYTALRRQRLPRPIELLCVLLAIGGTFLLVTHGNPDTLTIPLPALIWGIVSGVSGLGSNVSKWLGPPSSQRKMTDTSRRPSPGEALVFARNKSASVSPAMPRPPTVSIWRRDMPLQLRTLV